MSFTLFDRVKESATTTGTGNFTLAGTSSSFRRFSAVFSTNDTFYYCIQHQTADEWETGYGTYSASNTLTRTAIIASSNSGSAVSFSVGTKDVFVTAPAITVNVNPARTDGRLTLTSGDPIQAGNVTGSTSVFFTPFQGNTVALYTGSYWKYYTFAELTLALGTVTALLPYDVFIFDNAGTLTLEKVAWTDALNRATAITTQDGVYVKSGTTTKKYLGTFTAMNTTQTGDFNGGRYLWNYYNRIEKWQAVIETTDFWTQSVTGWRAANGSSSNGVSLTIGVSEDPVHAYVQAAMLSLNTFGASGIGVDSTSVNSAQIYTDCGTADTTLGVRFPVTASYIGYPGVGFHQLTWLEYRRSGTITWYGDGGLVNMQSGIQAWVRC